MLLDMNTDESEKALKELNKAQLVAESREITFVQEERAYRQQHTMEISLREDADDTDARESDY